VQTIRLNLKTKIMNTKNILLGFFSLMTFASYAQTEKSGKAETKTTVTELKVETKNLDELKNFDWNMVKEMFQENDTEQEITLAFAYVNKSNMDKSKIRVDNFKIKLTCQKTDLEKLTARLKKSFDEMVEINDQIIKN
jgi:tRNA A37 N6-isopentenylltransferase MiaA